MTKRLKYDETHWSRLADVEKGLEQYLKLGDLPFNKTKFRLFLRLAGDVRGKRVLDYGGGAGIMAVPLAKAGADTTLVDAEANALRTARFYAEREHVTESVKTVHSERFPETLRDNRYDLVIAKDIIEHIDRDQEFLSDLAGCQEKGGRLLLSTQNDLSLNYILEGSYQKYWCKNNNWRGWDQTHLRFYNYKTLTEKLEAAGYRPVKWAGVFIIPYSILSWVFLLKVQINLPSLRFFDLAFGSMFPFNRLGWNIIVSAEKR